MACRSCRSCLQLLPRQPASIGARTSRHASVLQRSPPSRSPGVQSRGLHGTAARRSAETSQLQHIIKSRKTGVARRILNWFPKYADAAHLYGATEPLYRSFASQADYEISPEDRRNGTVKRLEGGEEVGTGQGPWHDVFHLPATFATWSQVTMLHMYLMVVRLRCLDLNATRAWQKQLEEHFFWDAEARMDVKHAVTSASVRQRYLKDLFLQWRGALLSYDEGLVRGDAVLAAAAWRNVFAARPDVDVRHLAAVVAWMRRVLRDLDRTPDADLQERLHEAFRSSPDGLLPLVDEPTKELEAFEAAVRAAEAEKPKKPAGSRFS